MRTTLLEKDNTVTIHQRNVQALTVVINIHKGSILSKGHSGVETFGYKAGQMWGNVPKDIQEAEDISTLKRNIINYWENKCNCNLCEPCVANFG